ncbi:MAG: cytochrome c biogenesis CcdA family protein [Victivallales bacterium]
MIIMKKNTILLFCFLILQGFNSFSAEKCRVIYFMEKNCPEKCKEVDEIILPQLIEVYGNKIEVVKLDLEIPENFETLMAFEGKYGIPPGEVPEFYTSFGTVQKTDNIKKKLAFLIEEELSSGKSGPYSGFFNKYSGSERTGMFNTVASASPADIKKQNPLKLYYFYKPGCLICSRLDISMRYFSKKYPEQLKIFHCKINDSKSKVINEALCIRYSIPDKLHLATPAVFFGRESFIGEKSFKNLDVVGKVASAIKTADKFPTPEFSIDELIKAERSINSRYDKISWTAVLSAGLIDGINPCAFVTIIFLLSYIALLEYGKKKIILVGLSFTLAVFITYLMMGIGFLKAVDYLRSIPNLAKYAYYSGSLIAGFVGIMNLIDCFKMKKGLLQDMNLKLNNSIRMKINTVIRKNIKLHHYMLGAALIGFSVSVFELACTGQTYLPTILFIVNTQGTHMKAVVMLILYNAAFIVPLIIVFMLFFVGVSDRQLSVWLKNHAGKIKLATGVIFIAISVLLLVMQI